MFPQDRFEALALAYAYANAQGKTPLEVLRLFREALDTYKKVRKDENHQKAKDWIGE